MDTAIVGAVGPLLVLYAPLEKDQMTPPKEPKHLRSSTPHAPDPHTAATQFVKVGGQTS